MKTAVRFFAFWATFSLIVAIVYWFLSYERAGSLFLVFMFLAPLLIGSYLYLRARALGRAEDDPNAEHAAQAGQTVGRFPGGSFWPFMMGIGAVVGLEGFVYGIWLLVLGVIVFVVATVGLMQESRG
jgi:hypothetical protein